jgi:acyl-CoA reductase-like NAD-dependent aldehyde dehydrogenase
MADTNTKELRNAVAELRDTVETRLEDERDKFGEELSDTKEKTERINERINELETKLQRREVGQKDPDMSKARQAFSKWLQRENLSADEADALEKSAATFEGMDTKDITVGNPLNTETQVGAQASNDQYEKIKNYFEVGREEGAEVLVGGTVAEPRGAAVAAGGDGEPPNKGYYIEPTIFRGHNRMRVFQEEIFGPVTSLTTFEDVEEAIEISNETLYGLGAGVWTRDAHQLYRVPRAIKAGRVWVNCYHLYPAHAAFGGYKKSGFGRENHKMMLNHYRQTKNMLVSYDKDAMGFF